MIVGAVQPNGDAVVELKIRGPKGVIQLPVIVDTGFTESLALPPVAIAKLGLPQRDAVRMILADGSTAEARLHSGEVEWFGQMEQVLVVQVGGTPLIGMTMLLECRLEIEVVPGGPVQISRMQ